jgi:arylsulfatase B
MVTALDRAIGEILQSMENNGLQERTLVWFFSDNGGTPKYGADNSPLRGAKHTEWEGGVRVVSLLRWPGQIEAGTRNDQLIAYIDVAPTLLNLTDYDLDVQFDGINVGESFDGRSLPERYVFLGNSGIVGQEWKMNQGELFKINLDMGERNDLSATYPEIVIQLDSLLREFNQMRTRPGQLTQDTGWNPPENWTMPEKE